MIITSKQNEMVKQIKALDRKKERQATGLFLLEGLRLFEEALHSGINIKNYLWSERLLQTSRGERLLQQLKSKGLEGCQADENILTYASFTETSQGIVGSAYQNNYQWQDILKNIEGMFFVVDGLQDPGNLGTIIRSAEAAGIGALFLTPGTVDQYNEKVVRSAMGSLFRLPIAAVSSIEEFLAVCQDGGIRILTSTLSGELTYDQVDYSGKVAIVIGNEGHGAQKPFLLAAAHRIVIPLNHPVESLNASVAASIFMFEARRQRGKEV